MKLAIIDDINFIQNNLERIKIILEKEGATAVPLSDPAYFYLMQQGIKCLSYHDFESGDMYNGIYDRAREWGINWYKPNGKDWTEADGYSLGHLFEWPMIHFFTHLLRVFISTETVLKNTRPKEIIVITSSGVNVFGEISRWKHMDITMLPQLVDICLKKMNLSPLVNIIRIEYSEPLNISNWNLKPLRKVCKRMNLLLSGLIRLNDRFLGKRKRLVFFEGFRHFEGIFSSGKLRKFELIHLQKNIGLSLLLKLYFRGIRIESINSDERGNSAFRLIFDVDGLEKELTDYFIFNENNLFAAAWPRLESLLTDFFPGSMHTELRSVISMISGLSPHCVVTENDNTYYEKMIVTVAKKIGIPTVVVQNGETWIGGAYKNKDLSIHDFYPLMADIFLAYGKVNFDWLKEMGVDQSKVRITGSSRFDTYYKDTGHSGNGRIPKKRVLILLNDFGFNEGVVTQDMPISRIHRHLLEFARLARSLPKVNFIVRPHSNEHLWDHILKDELPHTGNLCVSRKDTLPSLLKDTGLVVGYLSTAMVEALVSRIPVISLDVDGNCEPFALWKYGLSKRITSFTELRKAILQLLFDKEERGRFLEGIEKNIGLFNYGDDGAASERIASELKEILTNVAKER